MTFKTKPYDHQLEHFEASRAVEWFATLWEMGVGKSKVMIDIICWLFLEGYINGVVVVAPGEVPRNWIADEIPIHAWEGINVDGHHYQSPKSKTKWHAAACKRVVDHPGLSFLTISYDAIITANGKKVAKQFLLKRKCMMILDEAHHIKNIKAKRTKTIIAAGRYAAYRRVLSGTPVAQGPFDLYSQFMFLDEEFWKREGFPSFTVFKHYYGVWQKRTNNATGHQFDYCAAYRNLDELQKIIAPYSSRLLKDDVLDLPEKIYQKRYFELTKEQEKYYRALREDFMVEIGETVVDATMAIVRLLRMQQVTCGYMGYYDDMDLDENNEPKLKMKHMDGKNPRLELLREICEEVHHQVIIWARFRMDIDLICEALGDKATRFDGGVSADQAWQNQLDFKAGKYQFIVANPAKGQEGLTWHCAKTVIYYSNSFKLVARLQSEDRAHRIGQDQSVNYIDIIAPGTCDEKIVGALRDKKEISQLLLGDKMSEWI
jgi:SNF2 family DNA or RNA helicase